MPRTVRQEFLSANMWTGPTASPRRSQWVIGSGESIVALCRDITERKRVEDAVRRASRFPSCRAERHHHLGGPQVCLHHVAVRLRHLKLPPDRVASHFYHLPEAGFEGTRRPFRGDRTDAAFPTWSTPWRRRMAALPWAPASPMLNADGTRGYRGSCTDITERKRRRHCGEAKRVGTRQLRTSERA